MDYVDEYVSNYITDNNVSNFYLDEYPRFFFITIADWVGVHYNNGVGFAMTKDGNHIIITRNDLWYYGNFTVIGWHPPSPEDKLSGDSNINKGW